MADTLPVSESGGPEDLEQAAAVFAGVRPRLFGIAYRMLGSASRSRGPGAGRLAALAGLRPQPRWTSPAAFLATTDHAAGHQRRPVRTRPPRDLRRALAARTRRHQRGPATSAPSAARRWSFAVLLLLERLSPTERAAYVLREAFDYPYRQIADIVQAQRGGRTPAGQPGPQARARRASHARDRSRAAPAADGLRRRRPLRRPDRAGRALRRGRDQLLRRRRRRTRLAHPRGRARRGWRSTSGRSPADSGPESTWRGRARTGRPPHC